MVLSSDQERVKLLLKDTITLLCRNGLSFKSKFNIEALIGVTLDDDDVFLVSINEMVKSEQALAEEALKAAGGAKSSVESESDSTGEQRTSPGGTGRRRHRKRKRRVKAEDYENQQSDATYPDITDEEDNSNMSIPVDAKKAKVNIKTEENSDDEDNDIVFIKQELDSTWPPSGSQHGANYTADHGFNLSDVNLTPVGQDGTEMWPQSSQQQQQQHRMPYPPRMQHPMGRTSTVTSGEGTQDGESQLVGADGQMTVSSLIPGNFFRNKNILGPAFEKAPVHLKLKQMPGFEEMFYPGQRTSPANPAVNDVYSCDECPYQSRYKHLVKEHKKAKHTGGNRCSMCGKGFAQTSSLNRHMRTIHGTPSAECEQSVIDAHNIVQ